MARRNPCALGTRSRAVLSALAGATHTVAKRARARPCAEVLAEVLAS